jgi:hypothetical protein
LRWQGSKQSSWGGALEVNDSVRSETEEGRAGRRTAGDYMLPEGSECLI